jgi:DNA-binding NarL/FixJ family response regulator
VVGEAADGAQCVRLAAALRPDVALIDVRMPRLDGIAATGRITSGAATRTRVLVVTLFDLDEYVFGALCAGASGFLLKDVGRAQLIAGVRVVAGGDALLAPAVLRRMLNAHLPARPATTVHTGLAERETEVLRRIAGGQSNAEIARDLQVSLHTVKTHVAHVLTKLGLRDRVHAVIYAYRTGLTR